MNKKDENYYKDYIRKILKEKGKFFDFQKLEKQNKILYGTFGYHDGEPPHSIIYRKTKELQHGFSLWGTTINEEAFQNVKKFCNNIVGDVYLFLKFTTSSSQKKEDSDKGREIWSIKDIISDGNYYSYYIDENGKNVYLNPKKTNIVVKGSDQQKVAFFVEDYFLYSDNFKRKTFLSSYTGTICSNNYNISGEKLCTLNPCYLLTRKEQSDMRIETTDNNNLAIVLKLKSPYIVKLLR